MNKQELKEQIQGWSIAQNGPSYDKGNVSGIGPSHKIGTLKVLSLINLLDEPKRVVVPQFAAEHIEYHRGLNSPMRDLFSIAWIDNNELVQWLYKEPGADDTLARAWLNGYEVEREKLYTVEIPDPEKPNGKKTNLAKFKGKVFLSSTMSAAPLTEAEIKRNHEWAWQWAEEVKEVGK